jgi:hypothetical protein
VAFCTAWFESGLITVVGPLWVGGCLILCLAFCAGLPLQPPLIVIRSNAETEDNLP